MLFYGIVSCSFTIVVFHICLFIYLFLFFSLLFLIQYNKYNTIIQHISAPVPTVDNTRIQIYMLMLYM